MFFDVRRVVVVTIAAFLSYLGLLIAEPQLIQPIHYHICFLLALAVAGRIFSCC